MERLTKTNEKFSSFPLDQIRPILLNKDRFILLETQRFDRDNYLSYLFFEPIALITCFNLNTISESFQKLEIFLDEGYWAAGFFSYEMGYGWEDFKVKRRFSFPLIWLGIFRQPLVFNHRLGNFLNPLPDSLLTKKTNSFSMLSHHKLWSRRQTSTSVHWRENKYQIRDISLNEKLPEYVRNIQKIKDYIAQGLTYQVNYTIKCKFRFQGSSLALYKNLRNTQPVAYTAFIKDKQFSLLSFSPELFFRKRGRTIEVKPMKGTISRGRIESEDRLQMKRLKASLKDRSENVMIVDLLRNDLGRISEMGSVRVNKLYTVEKYNTLFQMTSTIQARLKDNLSIYELFRSIFPSGSVTGAPKISTMEIIKELEKQERRVYTGAIGFFKPNRDAVFNVAIRTLRIGEKSGEMGIGSGIVYDSDPVKEYQECKLKALFFTPLDKGLQQDKLYYLTAFTQKMKEFQLIETMRWSRKTGFFLLPYHLERLKSSAVYFNFSLKEEEIMQGLKRISKCLDPAFDYRVRLLLFPTGQIQLSYQRIKGIKKPSLPKITFARRRTDSQDLFLYHKTTNRQRYDQEYREIKRAGLFDVIFENERNEITEGAISNIFVRKGEKYYTPPVSCGLLNGVYRRYFMREKALLVSEKILRRKDLYQADAIYLTNAVRGITLVRLF